ncbi:MAG: Kiwa anti-phage protein KwaB-like domain-containing protein [Sedimentibacter sp.]|jgi:hypothetical protein
MSLKEIYEILTDINLEENDSFVELYLINKKNSEEYYSYKLTVEKKLQEELIEIVSNSVFDVQNKNICEYNPIGQIDSDIEKCSLDYIKNANNVLASMVEDSPNRLELLPEVKDIHSYCIKIKKGDLLIITFRRFNKLRRLRAGFIGTVVEGRFKSLDGELIGLYNDIDIIIFNDDVFILNHIALERIFDIGIQFKEKAKETLQDIKETDIIDNFDKFEEDALNNLNVIKRLTKIKENKTLPKVFDNFENVPKVIEHFGLNIELNQSKDKIIYVDKTQIEDITLLMNDSYYETIIAGVPGIDKLK